ncbi:MAG: hypothetical protein R2731_08910 [Nocardioides sp.]
MSEQTGEGASSGPSAAASSDAATRPAKKSRKPKATKTRIPLPEPTGPCAASDVVVTLEVPPAAAGGDIRIKLRMHTRFSVACTWVVSPRTLTLKITSGADDIWSSQDCRGALERQEVTLRAAKTRTVAVVWDGRRSNPGCAGPRYWALPGWYHVAASALAGEPADVQFRLSKPPRPVITESPSPDPAPSSKPSSKPKPRQSPSASPSGAVEPNG